MNPRNAHTPKTDATDTSMPHKKSHLQNHLSSEHRRIVLVHIVFEAKTSFGIFVRNTHTYTRTRKHTTHTHTHMHATQTMLSRVSLKNFLSAYRCVYYYIFSRPAYGVSIDLYEKMISQVYARTP